MTKFRVFASSAPNKPKRWFTFVAYTTNYVEAVDEVKRYFGKDVRYHQAY